jgi:cardiolipin synthase
MAWQTTLEFLGVLIPISHIIGIGFAAHATMYTRTSQGAIAWVLSLIFFPYVAAPLYLVFGRKKFVGYVEARRKGNRRIDHMAEQLLASIRPAESELTGDEQRFAVLERFTLFPFCGGNKVRLLVDGKETFDAIFAAIDSAQTYLLVQFFIVHDDEIGRQLQERLIARAKAGVKIYFLYDEIGSIRLPGRYIAKLRAAGVAAQPFNTRRGWRNRFQINFRNHRKIVVADGRAAYVGGHNIGDEYLGKSPRFGHWRDTHVEIIGPTVAAVQWCFLEDWNWSCGHFLDLPPMAATSGNNQPEKAIVIPSSPADDIGTCTLMFLSLISAARRRLWITSPYFVPDETVYDALQLAALRGVDVRIILPAKPDHLLVYLAAFSYLESAESVGVKFYRYQAGFLHQKVLLVDDDLAAVGTANLDNRSMRLNFEITALFADRTFAAEVAAMLQRDFDKCDRATPGDLKRRSIFFRVAVRIARLLSPVQ